MVRDNAGFSEGHVTEFQARLEARLRSTASELHERFGEVFDSTVEQFFREGLRTAGAQEGTIWLIDQEGRSLVPTFNSGARASDFVGSFRQSLRSGMISMVVATEQPICENEVLQNRQQDPTLDRQLGLETCAMIAVPLYFTNELRGVVSAVLLREQGAPVECPAGFTPEALQSVQRTTNILGRLIEHRILAQCCRFIDRI